MTEPQGIVVRLREEANADENEGGWSVGILREAADRIEQFEKHEERFHPYCSAATYENTASPACTCWHSRVHEPTCATVTATDDGRIAG